MSKPPSAKLAAHPAIRRAMGALGPKLEHHAASILALGVRAAAVLAGFAVTYMIGRWMGAEATGQFALASQTAVFLAVLGLAGLDVAVIRHFAKAIADQTQLSLASMAKVCGVGLGLMATICVALWLAEDWIWAPLFGDIIPRAMLPILCLLLFARGGSQLLGSLLRSQHRFTLGQAIAALTIPSATAIALATGIADTVEDALWAAAFGGFFSLVLAFLAMRRHISRAPNALDIRLRTMMASALPLWGVAIANNVGDWYGLAVAASMLGAAEAGFYRVAVQIAAVLQIISIALFSVYSAKISSAHHAENPAQVALLARSAVRLSAAIALPATIFLVFAAEFLLLQIGEEFVSALPLVYILVIGQLAFTLTGPCGLVLAMSGNERANLMITVCGTLLLLACVPIAASYTGLVGIAVCISAIMLLRNITAYIVVRQKLGINIWAGTVSDRQR